MLSESDSLLEVAFLFLSVSPLLLSSLVENLFLKFTSSLLVFIRAVVKRKLLLLHMLVFTFSLYGQETVRIATYNLKQYPRANSAASYIKIVMDQIKPTIFLAVELDGTDAVDQLLVNVLTPKYKASTEVNIYWGTGNECAVFYIDSLLTYLGSNMIPADPRPFAEFKFVHKITRDTLIIFGVHLKANTTTGDNSVNITRRANSVNILRYRTSQFNGDTNFIVAGDFNILTSTELGFQRLLDQSYPGYVYDPQDAVGNWANNSSFAYTHTYSPSNLKSRLDMILISESIKMPGGIDLVDYKIFGNDGNHYAKAVTNGPNSWFSDITIGNALLFASDHLPVYADFKFGVPTRVSTTDNIPTTFELKQNYPNPFNPETVISYQLSEISNVQLKVFDLLGREVATLVDEVKNAGIHHFTFSPASGGQALYSSLTSGVYFYRLQAGMFVQTKKMVLLR